MESLGAIAEGEWSSFSGMYSNEESEFMMQFLNNNISWPDHELAMNMAGVDENLMFSSGNADTNICHFSLENTSYRDGRSNFFPAANHESYYYASDSNQILAAKDGSLLDYCIGEALNQEMGSGSIEESCVNLPKADKNMQFETEAQFREPEPSKEVELRYPMQKSKKRCFNSGDVQNKKRNVKSRKNQKLTSTSKNDEENDSAISEDDSNGGVTSTSEDPNGAEVVNENGKTRPNRKGPATDPQSLYARKRRERINERLRTLQNLVPNGTKVDISTMLEEAVQYVKFLQLQIKLLSSDDQWMYAPLAYNGMDLGLNLNVSLQ